MSLTPRDLKVKEFSNTDSRKYLEFPLTNNRILILTLVGYGTGLLERYSDTPIFRAIIRGSDKVIHPLEWDSTEDMYWAARGIGFRAGIKSHSYNLLDTYKITERIAQECVIDYVEDRHSLKNLKTPKRLSVNKQRYFNRWAAKPVSEALKEIIRSFNIDEDVIKLNKRCFAVCGPNYNTSVLRILKGKEDFPVLVKMTLESELSNFLIYILDNYYSSSLKNLIGINELLSTFNMDNIIHNLVYRDATNSKVTEYCIRNIPTALPGDCIDYIANLGQLKEPIFGRAEYKYLLARFLDRSKNGLILTKYEIKYLTNLFFDGKLNYSTISKLRGEADNISALSVDELALKLQLKYERDGGFS